MKQIITAVGLLFFSIQSMAQSGAVTTEPQQSLAKKMAQIFEPLDKSQLATGYLYDQAPPLVSPARYRGSIDENNAADMNQFGAIYGHIVNSFNMGGGISSPAVYLDKIKAWKPSDPMEIAALVWQYDRLRPDAIEQNLITYSNGQVFDVPDRPQSPYFQDTVYTVSFLKGVASSLSPVFSLPETLWFSNLSEKPLIHIDAGDGSGWQLCSPGQTIQPHYSNAGLYDVQLRFTFANGSVRYAHTPIQIEAPIVAERGWNNAPDDSITITASQGYLGTSNSATVHVFYNCGNKKLFKPLIIFEGLEVVGAEALFRSWGELQDGLLFPFFNNGTQSIADFVEKEGYDLIYVDWAAGSGMDYIQRNAFLAESVIEWVNEKKAEAGSTEQNVVIGFSMGGLVAMYALRDMQGKGMDHDTRLFISYDAPLQGANIPMGTQETINYLGTIVFTANVFGLPPVPAITNAYNALTSPAARQMLKYHFLSVNGTAEPVNTEHVAFMAELNALGALSMRHVAISNGSNDGTAIENNIIAGATMFNVTADDNFFCYNVPLIGTVCDGKFHLDITVRATGNNATTTIFDANASVKILLPPSYFESSYTTTCFTKPYDVAPGGSSNVGVAPLSLLATALPAGMTIGGTGLTATHHCFIPTFSSLNAPEPANILTGQSCGSASRCSSPTEPSPCSFSGLPEFNEEHVILRKWTASLIVEELVTLSANPYALPVSPAALTTYYNAGIAPQDAITDLVIASPTGKLSINNTGKVGYATGSEPVAPGNLFKAYTRCGNITVEDAAQLVVGADNGTKDGVLFVTSGATVHIKPGGALRIMGPQSELRILPGAKLILDPGAIVLLENQESKIRIEGQLVVNGDIVFSGKGYFDFAGELTQLALGAGYNIFNLKGFSKQNRFVRLSSDIDISGGKRLNWGNGLLEAEGGSVFVSDNAGVNFTNMTITTISGASQSVLNAQGGGIQNFLRTDISRLVRPIYMENSLSLNVEDCTFDYAAYPVTGFFNATLNVKRTNFNHYSEGIRWMDATQATLEDSNFEGQNNSSGLILYGVPVVVAQGCYFANHIDTQLDASPTDSEIAAATPAFFAEDGLVILKECTLENNSVGIKSLTLPGEDALAAAFLLVGATTVRNNTVGIHIQGDETKGLVLADCSNFITNRQGITGTDITLMLDSENTSLWVEDTDTPNAFISDVTPLGGTTQDHIRVCYNLKQAAPSRLMRNNWWAVHDPVTNTAEYDPAPESLISLLNNTCSKVSVNEIITPRPSELTDYCAQENKPAVFGINDSETDCQLSTNNNGDGTQSVNWQWHEAYYLLKTDTLPENGVEMLRPVADLWESDMSSYSDNCQQYIASARAIVDGVDNAMGLNTNGRPSERKNKPGFEGAQMKIYPNPAHQVVNIVFPEDVLSMEISNLSGQVVSEQQVSGFTTHVIVHDWPEGVYVVSAEMKNGKQIHQKLVVVK